MMTVDPLAANAVLVDALSSALRRGGSALGNVPALLKRLLTEESWRDFTTQRGEHVHHERFAEFVVTPPLRGLGADVALIRRIVGSDREATDRLDQALQNPHGGDRGKSNNVTLAPAGNASDQALRRLRKDAPALHADVLAGRLSPHAAMVKAGLRPRTFTVRADPRSAAATLRRNLTAEQLAELAQLLAEA